MSVRVCHEIAVNDLRTSRPELGSAIAKTVYTLGFPGLQCQPDHDNISPAESGLWESRY